MENAESTLANHSEWDSDSGKAWDARPAIRSEEWAQVPGALDYTSVVLDEVLVERLVWQRGTDKLPLQLAGTRLPLGSGHIWFRFWFPAQGQLVEKYFDAQGQCLGMKIEICAALQIEGGVWTTPNLFLGVWIAPDGSVSVIKESAFEDAVAKERLSTAEAQEAEREIRRLTAGVARGRFPPPLVRNWQIDLEQVSKSVGDRN
jgi:predicted RNA-binding protein associated with RNAse of E/G family